jgi:hypothetical protein
MFGTWVTVSVVVWLLGVRLLARRHGTRLETAAASLPTSPAV